MPARFSGTAAYMSPEQAKGLPVDCRTDVFAFGAVLYEMLTGRPAFAGETMSDILARVIEREPDWSRLPKDTPAEIRRLLRRCLQKDRTRRLQVVADARIEIDEAVARPEGRDDHALASTAAHRRERIAWMLAASLLIGIVALALPRFVGVPEDLTGPAESRLDIVTPATSDPVAMFSFAISPDGTHVVYVASGDGQPRLWLRVLSAVIAQPLAGTEGASYPFWSPDSRSVGFFSNGQLKRIDIGAGLPQRLAPAPNSLGGTWSPDGRTILFAPGEGLFRVSASGGEPVGVTAAPNQAHRFPHFLPDGQQFLFLVTRSRRCHGIYLGSLDSPETRRLTPATRPGLRDAGVAALQPPAHSRATSRSDARRPDRRSGNECSPSGNVYSHVTQRSGPQRRILDHRPLD